MQDNKPAQPHARGKATILIVDDSPTIRKLVSMTLESRGYTVTVACDGVDGLAKLQEGMPDLILSDITMPRLDGYQFCKVVKSNKETKHIPVIMLSGNDGLFDKVRGRMAGSANYITKPFEPNNLVKEIEKFVKATRPAQTTPAPIRQPATAQGAPVTAKSAAPIDKPADPIAAKQLSKKLSGIYIPGASSGSLGRAAEQQHSAAPSPRGNGDQPAPRQQQPQQQPQQQQRPAAVKRPLTKHNDEPEIKIFYHGDTQSPAAPMDSASQQQSSEHRSAEQHSPGTQTRQPAAHMGATPQRPAAAQPGSAGPQQTASQIQAPVRSFKATCSGCGTVYANIKQEHIGKHARCKKCGTRFLITA